MKLLKSYIVQSFAILVMASGFFLLFRTYLPSKIFTETTPQTTNVVVDSLMLEVLQSEDSLQIDKEKQTDTVPQKVTKAIVSDELEHRFKGMVYLTSFFESLYALEKEEGKSVRIAYFGDSMTDGDLIVQDLRGKYQFAYGGKGVGFVPITSESAQSRASVTHRFSPNWKTQSYLNVKKPSAPFGISGQVFFANDTVQPAWVSFKAGGIANMTRLYKPTLYYGKSTNKEGYISWVSGKDTLIQKLTPNKLVNKLQLSTAALQSLKIEFKQADSIPIYGFDFTDERGIQVDNFSSRGNSGLPLSLFNIGVMNSFQHALNYDLIILHYGTNVLNYGSYNYRWYTKQMSKVVEHLKVCFPETAILVISTADKATKYDLRMQTDSAVVPLVNAQRRYAMDKHTGFINLFEQMGGSGAMVEWVESEPSKANKDYTHFNYRGAKEVAKLIFSELEKGYENYKFGREEGTLKPNKRRANVMDFTKDTDTVKHPQQRAIPSDTMKENLPVDGAESSEENRKSGESKGSSTERDSLEQKKNSLDSSKQREKKEAEQGRWVEHIVQEGETLMSLSRRYKVGVEEIKELNELVDDDIQIAQSLYIPIWIIDAAPKNTQPQIRKEDANSGTKFDSTADYIVYRVKDGDTLNKLAREFGVSVEDIISINRLQKDRIEIDQILYIPRVSPKKK